MTSKIKSEIKVWNKVILENKKKKKNSNRKKGEQNLFPFAKFIEPPLYKRENKQKNSTNHVFSFFFCVYIHCHDACNTLYIILFICCRIGVLCPVFPQLVYKVLLTQILLLR